MLHARKDYQGRIVDKDGLIPDDEPVFLLRARDALMVPTLEYYRLLLIEAGAGSEIVKATERHLARVREWQYVKPSKLPDVPPGEAA